MTTVTLLLLTSAAVGLMIGPRYNAYMLVGSAPILAMTVPIAARLSGFGLLAMIGITFACLTASQMAYLLITWVSMSDDQRLPDEPLNDQTRDDGQDDVPNKHARQDNAPPYLTS